MGAACNFYTSVPWRSGSALSIDVSGIDGMIRYDERCALGPSPSVVEIEWLARRAGFRSLLNLNEEGEPNEGREHGPRLSPNVEASWAHTYGLEHERATVSRERLDPSGVDRFLWTLGAIERPVYVHSAGGARAAALLTIHLGLERGLSGAEALRAAKERGLDSQSAQLEREVREEIDRRLLAATLAS